MSSSSSDEAPPAPVAKARASSPDSDAESAAKIQSWLEKLLNAFMVLPATDPAKGVSVMKVRQYLKTKYHVSKAQMKEIWTPTMKIALARKLLIKTTALQSIVIGSARLSPAIAISRLQKEEEGEAAAEDDRAGGAIGRKRRATSEDDAIKVGSAKRRIPFGKMNQM